jgi:hypothetical protein
VGRERENELKSPIDRALDTVDWVECKGESPVDDDGLPYATHEGVLKLGSIELKCYQLSNGQRVIDAADAERFFGMESPE